jgi:hypothetical protein
MKALSLKQPWLWAVLHASKLVENRRWNTHYRGPILLHASKGCTQDYYAGAVNWMAAYDLLPGDGLPPALHLMPRGGIVGRARIVDVIPPGNLPPTFRPASWAGIDMRWHMPEQFGFVLADVESLPFVAWPGALNLFPVPDDYATRAT